MGPDMQARSTLALALLWASLLAGGGCIQRWDDDTKHAVSECTACHGSPARAGSDLSRSAPPTDLAGNTDPSSRGVGAHDSHLRPSSMHRTVACSDCHVVPTKLDDPGHVDGKGLAMSGVASSNGAVPSWDPKSLTCSGTWCHGPGAPGVTSSPAWTRPPATLGCADCHGAPPPAPHPQMTQCSLCHGAVVGPDNRTIVNPSLHVNGVVDVAVTQPCQACHERDVVPEPPHERHQSTKIARPIACSECHLVKSDDPTHLDGQVDGGGLAFSGVSTSNDAGPSWDPQSLTCSRTWCHALGSSAYPSPVWAQTNNPLRCTDCHGMPPPLPHPQLVRCTPCHGAVVAADNRTIVGPALHVNGVVDVIVSASCNNGCHGSPPPSPHPQIARCSLCHAAVIGPDETTINPLLHQNGVVDVAVPTTCNGCHGSAESPAPPPDSHGNTDHSAPGVGAHQKHLQTPNGRQLACGECHVVPTDVADPTHIDGRSDPVFSGVATTGGSVPVWDAAAMTCSQTWCHGPGVPTSTSPAWTASGPLPCDGCHGMPPKTPHPRVSRCSLCHGDVVGADDRTIVNPSLHIDGVVERTSPVACDSCHGSQGSAAPPPDLSKATDVSAPGVGAHTKHLDAAIGRAVPCAECHVVPGAVDDPGHLDGGLVTFSGVSTSGGTTPSWDPSSLTCSATWCHGPDAPATTSSPAWNRPSAPLGCTSCHGMPPPAPHPQLTECSMCHGAVVRPDNVTISNPSLHVDGVVEVVKCTGCHGSATSPAPPPDLAGNTDPSARGVGAHEKHLFARGGRPVLCADCHVVPATISQPGHIGAPPAKVTFSSVVSADGQTPSWNGTTCSNTHCHDPVIGTTQTSGGTLTAPAWVQPLQATCGSCHGLPPPLPHPQPGSVAFSCSNCHSDIDSSMHFTDVAKHINGVIDF
jgi:predicted CxxxxCH...CXXCH cytochrome family protein